jgi:thiosulfate/3-mercaptopyruvate sulfurtransferase
LRIYDCSTQLVFEQGGDRPYRVVDCREEHEAGHILGAGCLDLQGDFSTQDSPFAMTLADPETVARAFAKEGVADNTRVILYSRRSVSWATRFWWMLRWLGFDHAAVLNGGYDKWIADERPVSTRDSAYPMAEFSINLRPGLFVGKEDVLEAIDNPDTCTINALGADVFSGENPRYGRPGRIPGSVNVPQVSLLDPQTLAFLPADKIASHFAAVGADRAQNRISYCGGGIFATVDAFWLHQLGHQHIAVYENSMSEWGPDRGLPIERD